MYATGDTQTWVNTARHGHNAYIDVALMLGVPGLGVILFAYLIAPLRDLQRITAGHGIDPATMLFLRLWFFALVSASFESVLLNGNNATCCMFMMAVFGLRLRASHRMIAA
jgi:O-antigen ligase